MQIQVIDFLSLTTRHLVITKFYSIRNAFNEILDGVAAATEFAMPRISKDLSPTYVSLLRENNLGEDTETSRSRKHMQRTFVYGERILYGRLVEARILSHNRKGLSAMRSAPLHQKTRVETTNVAFSYQLSFHRLFLSSPPLSSVPLFRSICVILRLSTGGFHGQFGRT